MGTVQFKDGDLELGAPIQVTTFHTAGAHNITATYSGDDTHAASAGTTPIQVVGKAGFLQIAFGLLIAFLKNLGLLGL